MVIKTETDFISLAKQAERQAESNPTIYTAKLTLLALLGYLVIFSVLAGLLILTGGLIANALSSSRFFLFLMDNKLSFASLLGIWVLVRALWVKFEPPEGYTLKRSEFPDLFAELDTLSEQLRCLNIHEVILDRNLSVTVLQQPRLGALGWHKNYLILGYPLLLMLPAEEMRSVLAHELGHHSARRDRFGGWIYRLRHTWLQLMTAFNHSRSWGGQLMHQFFNWYSPQFAAYSFAYARNTEYAADAMSAEITSPEVVSRALLNLNITIPYVEQHYWEDYLGHADEHEKPPHAPFQGLSSFLKDNAFARHEILTHIKQAMTVETQYADTHPSLKDRIAALAAEPQLPSSPNVTAADSWLGQKGEEIMAMFDEEWLSENRTSWQQRHEQASQSLNHHNAPPQKPSGCQDEALWNYACQTHETESSDAALALFLAYQARYPNNPDVALFIGLELLRQNDDAGLEQLRTARDRSSLLKEVANVGYQYLKNQSRNQAAKDWWNECATVSEIYSEGKSDPEGAVLLPKK